MATVDDLEARVAALEAAQADYRAVLAAVNALGANQGDSAMTLVEMDRRLNGIDHRLNAATVQSDDTNARVRSLEEATSEIRDLLIRALDR